MKKIFGGNCSFEINLEKSTLNPKSNLKMNAMGCGELPRTISMQKDEKDLNIRA